MKIDFSTIFLVIVCVIPGIFAQRSRDLICPRSFVDQGASGELGELVALGISTHGLLALALAVAFLFLGTLHREPLFLFKRLDSWQITQWRSTHEFEFAVGLTIYIFCTFAVSHVLGLIYGFWRLHTPLTRAVLRKSKWLKRHGVIGLLGERPIIYEVLNPQRTDEGIAYKVFVELEMKDAKGFYSGQLSDFAIVKDEEPHKPIFLIDPAFRNGRDDAYQDIAAEGIMIDLADAIQISVTQVAP